jgi:hypothetical protein
MLNRASVAKSAFATSKDSNYGFRLNGHNTKKEKNKVEVEVETRVKARLLEKEPQIIVICICVSTSGWKLGYIGAGVLLCMCDSGSRE